jgi:photosystem II stability/assembly factor-like uncharacterized protein
MYFSQIRVDPSDDKRVYLTGLMPYRSSDGGKTFQSIVTNEVHPDQHVLWIDPRDGRHMILGSDGGFYVTYDRMDHWDFLNSADVGQFYHVAVDNRRPYRVYGGLQDNGTWGGPSRSPHAAGPINEDWVAVLGGDGFQCAVDPQDPDLVYGESQDGNMVRRHLKSGAMQGIRPKEVAGLTPYRFNWNTPFFLSSHNAHIFYAGGNCVFRSLKQGDDLRPISPEISRTKRGTATALAESRINPDVLWAGTDDGFLWVTRDGGAHWTNVFEKVGLPGPRWVASIEASRFVEGRAYVAFDGHRSDDDEPRIFVTEDYGQTWKSLRANLPVGSTRVLREDVENADLLYLGTEFAVWASADRGVSWTKLNNNLPTVAVHEIAVHPTAGEIVVATHGRSLWALDVSALRQFTAATAKAKATLYRPTAAVRYVSEPERGGMVWAGARRFVGSNPPAGALIYYSIVGKANKATLQIFDYAGRVVKDQSAATEPGMHRVGWDLRQPEGRVSPQEAARWAGRLVQALGSSTSQGLQSVVAPALLAAPQGRRGGGGRGGSSAPAGMYRVVLKVDGEEFSQGLRVEEDPNVAASLLAVDEDDDLPEIDD